MSNRETHVPGDLYDWEVIELRHLSDMFRADYAIKNVSFDMREVCTSTLCGTVACIGGHIGLMRGWNEQLVGAYLDETFESGRSIVKLFFPITEKGWNATPRDAANAIDRFLAGHEPW
jgi:hypothetical protein